MEKSPKMKLMQKKAMENIASGKYKTYKDAMIDAGYSEGTAIHPSANFVGSKAVTTIFQQETQNISLRFNDILEKALQNCADAIEKGDKNAIDA